MIMLFACPYFEFPDFSPFYELLLQVTFIDDSDEFGITHDKAVPLQHVMPPPYDA